MNEDQMKSYKEGRNYMIDALIEEGLRTSQDLKVKQFITKFLRIHGDTNTEVK